MYLIIKKINYRYLAIGVVLFCYLLIDELKALSNPQEARPKNYFIYNISTIIILLNIFTAFFRIIGGIMIFVYTTILKIVKKREEYEREERLIAIENGRIQLNQNFPSNKIGKSNYISNNLNYFSSNNFFKNTNSKMKLNSNNIRIFSYSFF